MAEKKRRPEKCIIASYDEIGLKGRNKHLFIRQMLENIRIRTGLSGSAVEHRLGRVILYPPDETELNRACRVMHQMFGLRWFAEADQLPLDFSLLCEKAAGRARRAAGEGHSTFKVEAQRGNKKYPMRSLEINIELGELIRTCGAGLEVDVHRPDVTFHAEVRGNRFLLYTRKEKGAGGLPAGVDGRALHLISGGIDSPVAAWHLMKRGLQVDYLYFHSPPYTGEKALDKVRSLVRSLQQWNVRPARLYIPRFTRIQETIAEKTRGKLWTILHRRTMHRIAGQLADEYDYHAISTGDSLGQVASQTLANLRSIDEADSHLVLRPLVGMEKMEVMKTARRIGTYEISIRPFEDCCVLFAPKNPALHTRLADLHRAEEAAGTAALALEAIEEMKTELYGLSEMDVTAE